MSSKCVFVHLAVCVCVCDPLIFVLQRMRGSVLFSVQLTMRGDYCHSSQCPSLPSSSLPLPPASFPAAATGFSYSSFKLIQPFSVSLLRDDSHCLSPLPARPGSDGHSVALGSDSAQYTRTEIDTLLFMQRRRDGSRLNKALVTASLTICAPSSYIISTQMQFAHPTPRAMRQEEDQHG